MTPRILSAALALGLATAPALAEGFGSDDMSDAERQAFRDEVRAYLLDNPEVIFEAVAVLEARQAAQQVANDAMLVSVNAEALFDDGASFVAGNPDGDVTFVEFIDYRCGYCKRAYAELQELVELDGNIRVVYKEFPILGAESLLAARFAVSALQVAGGEAYEKLHDSLMTMRGNVTNESLTALATSLGLDATAIFNGMEDPMVDRILTGNHALAERMQISATPSFVVGDQILRGYMQLDAMQSLVAGIRDSRD